MTSDIDKIAELESKIKKLEEENSSLRIHIRDLTDKIYDKNQTINRLQRDSWDDVTYEREDR